MPREQVNGYRQTLELIQDLCSISLATMNSEKVCEMALDGILSCLNQVDDGYILLAEGPGGRLKELASRSSRAGQSREMNYAKGMVQYVLKNGNPLAVPDGTLLIFDDLLEPSVKTALCVPLKSRLGIRGVVYVQSRSEDRVFQEDDLFLLKSLGDPLALALETALLYERGQDVENALKRAQEDLDTAVYLRTAELTRARDEAERLSITDSLTGIYNHRHFMRSLDSEFARAVRYNRILSLLMVDIDYFKVLNDTYGHLCGDFVIKSVSQLFKGFVRSTDVVARYGGDELGIILPEIKEADALQVAEKLKEAIGSSRFEWLGKSINVSLCIGFASGPAPGVQSPLDLLKAADTALYRAKQGGRNLVVTHSP